MLGPDKIKWQEAMRNEMKSLQENHVWDIVEQPKTRKLLVVNGCSSSRPTLTAQSNGTSLDSWLKVFLKNSEVIMMRHLAQWLVRTVISLATQHGLQSQQTDVTTAFLNGDLQEEVYMKQPEGFEVNFREESLCKLNRSIYGLRQSPRCWNTVLDNKLKKMGFVQTNGDHCVYITSHGEMCIILVQCDDLLLACKSEKRMVEIKEELAKQFVMKEMSKVHHFLGVKVIQNLNDGEVWISQPAFTRSVLDKFWCEAVNGSEKINQAKFQSTVGSLLYLSTRTRPDIAYAVDNVARFCTETTNYDHHWTAINRIMRYMNGTQELGLLYSRREMKGTNM